jgi:hypothetical protein
MNVETEINEGMYVGINVTVHYTDKWMSSQKHVILILDILHSSNGPQYKPGVQKKRDPDSISTVAINLKLKE